MSEFKGDGEQNMTMNQTVMTPDSSGAMSAGHISAIDLGSNSFHMIVARVDHGEIGVLSKLAEKVQLAEGLDEKLLLTEEAQQRGIDCLQRFAQKITGIGPSILRVVGTNALRQARNRDQFLTRAEQVLGVPVEIISGREEARLIYLGVAHTVADDEGKRLVVDIGGGSTEFIIGERFEGLALESLHMGCVSYANRYFPDGNITDKAFSEAVNSARREIWSIEKAFKNIGWSSSVGASGTVRAIEQVLISNGWSEDGITLEGMLKARDAILQLNHCKEIQLDGLKKDRRAIFPSGLAILIGIFKQLDIQEMAFSDGALREGLLYDLLGRIQHEDVRDRTTTALAKRYHVDLKQASRVQHTALALYEAVAEDWEIHSERYEDLLRRAAFLHEIGLAISHSQFHKHGAYLLQHADLSGFSRQEQQMVASLVRCHRRKFATLIFEDLSESVRTIAIRLTVLLRMAVLLHHSRSDDVLPGFKIQAKDQCVSMQFDDGWIEQHPLTHADFLQEQQYLKSAGIELQIS